MHILTASSKHVELRCAKSVRVVAFFDVGGGGGGLVGWSAGCVGWMDGWLGCVGLGWFGLVGWLVS